MSKVHTENLNQAIKCLSSALTSLRAADGLEDQDKGLANNVRSAARGSIIEGQTLLNAAIVGLKNVGNSSAKEPFFDYTESRKSRLREARERAQQAGGFQIKEEPKMERIEGSPTGEIYHIYKDTGQKRNYCWDALPLNKSFIVLGYKVGSISPSASYAGKKRGKKFRCRPYDGPDGQGSIVTRIA